MTDHAASKLDALALERENRLARRAALLSLVVSVVLLVCKFWAYRVTQSQAVFSDAMETIVNVAAAVLALIVLGIAHKPADREHPYGHGKVEFFSAAFEGGLITFASIIISFEAVQTLVRGATINQTGIGLVVTFGAGIVNAILGWYLLASGRRHQSAALEASGHHVLSDFVTSAGVIVGLLLVKLTGYVWFDPLIALVVGIYLGYTGIRLVRSSVGGLIDEEDREIIEHLRKLVSEERPKGIIHLHHLRVMRSGRFHHIDAHAVVPEFWNVAEAHDRTVEFEEQLMRNYSYPGELHLHIDPCQQAYCQVCDFEPCPIRLQPFERKRTLSLEELTDPEEPQEFLSRRSRRG